MMKRNLAAVIVALWAIWSAAPAAADPGPTDDPGNVGTLHRPASKVSTATADDLFLAQIARWGMRVVDIRAAIAGAHELCAYLGVDGHTAESVIEQGLSVNPTMTRSDEIAFYNAAVGAYCPSRLRISGTVA